MEPTLHAVKEDELPAVKDWLEKFMPRSAKLYCTIRETLQGRWTGTTFCTLGWPNILAVGEMEAKPESPCYIYHSEPRTTSVFSPDPDHLEKLLMWPGFLDWSQPIIFQAVCSGCTPSILKLAKAKGGDCLVYANVINEARETELPPRPVPEGFYLSNLDPDLHTDYAISTWPHSRNHTDRYIRQLLRKFPSVGLFDKDGECIGLEIGNEYGAIGMLHVREEYRGRGLGKIITSQLAQKYFCDGLNVIAFVIKDNKPSRRMHTSCGFKEVGFADWVLYNNGSFEDLKKKMGYNGPTYGKLEEK
ncbi:hypothetical protein EGW08_021160 [Elysia chlorotica]|uniref:Glycine N-acyltransferase-like protein n=1 Tax=Elysia chlorotica TaxID=188477 RepID=A0A433SPC7_ELYCH|nr:hypothetical protein EGW08_021160 [Elysia chlorotica]